MGLLWCVLWFQLQSGSLENVEGIDLDRSARDLGVTSELRIGDAPLASPDISNFSGSSESSIHNVESSDNVAAVIASIDASIAGDESEDESSEATFVSDDQVRDSDSVTTTGSTATVIDGHAATSGGVTKETDSPTTPLATNELLDDTATQQEDNNSLDHHYDNHDGDEVDMKGEKVRAIAAKLSSKLGPQPGQPPQQQQQQHNGQGDVAAKVLLEGTSESSDTDSVNTTPSDSPAKSKLDGVVLRPPSVARAKNSGEQLTGVLSSLSQCISGTIHLGRKSSP